MASHTPQAPGRDSDPDSRPAPASRGQAPSAAAPRRLTLEVLRRARAATLAVPPAATGKTDAFHHGLLRLIEAAIAAEEELDRLAGAAAHGRQPAPASGKEARPSFSGEKEAKRLCS